MQPGLIRGPRVVQARLGSSIYGWLRAFPPILTLQWRRCISSASTRDLEMRERSGAELMVAPCHQSAGARKISSIATSHWPRSSSAGTPVPASPPRRPNASFGCKRRSTHVLRESLFGKDDTARARVPLALTLALLKRADLAVKTISPVEDGLPPPLVLVHAARIYTVAAVASSVDPDRAVRFADRAIGVLRRAVTEGFRQATAEPRRAAPEYSRADPTRDMLVKSQRGESSARRSGFSPTLSIQNLSQSGPKTSRPSQLA
jgi:hypothetical protein